MSGRTAEAKLDLLQGTLDLMVLQTLVSMSWQHGYGIARRSVTRSGKKQLGAAASNWRRLASVIGRVLTPSPGVVK